MYNSLIYFNENSRSTVEKALDLFKSSRQINFFFGKIIFEKAESYVFPERLVCFVGCVDLEDSLRLYDYLRALKFRIASI